MRTALPTHTQAEAQLRLSLQNTKQRFLPTSLSRVLPTTPAAPTHAVDELVLSHDAGRADARLEYVFDARDLPLRREGVHALEEILRGVKDLEAVALLKGLADARVRPERRDRGRDGLGDGSVVRELRDERRRFRRAQLNLKLLAPRDERPHARDDGRVDGSRRSAARLEREAVAVEHSHLLEDGRLAALARAEEEELHLRRIALRVRAELEGGGEGESGGPREKRWGWEAGGSGATLEW
jgi:hypothetical protein